ncbi:hypothetical protein MKX08_006533 [Trichoderma sp. CBMAI-0020]|nr:hypothetical protein MKX08_006533 [Trichoderma sp. CBMAI-0020]WOD46116.1 hypothetical protein [Trichoderma atroviride]
MSLRLGDTAIEYETLNDDSVPEAAKTLFTTITEIGRSNNILPDTMRETIKNNQGFTNEDFNRSTWKYCFKSADEPDNLPGQIPSIAQIKDILAMATECDRYRHEESSWNAMVHLRLLRFIFQNELGKQCDDFNAILCTTARPHREFKPNSLSAKMVDICVYADLDQNPELVAAVKAFSSTAPTKSVNHTDYFALQFRPIILSIETKQPGGGAWEKAQLQMGVWLSSHWAFLSWGARQKLLTQHIALGNDIPTDDLKAETLKVLSKLEFIPGIYINGHRWHLVLSTYKDGKTTLWQEWTFGETKNLMKTYSVIAGIRELTAWGRDKYIPWFKENILS